jgi:hypothetical protein
MHRDGLCDILRLIQEVTSFDWPTTFDSILNPKSTSNNDSGNNNSGNNDGGNITGGNNDGGNNGGGNNGGGNNGGWNNGGGNIDNWCCTVCRGRCFCRDCKCIR